MSKDLDTTTSVAEWVPIITARAVALIIALDHLTDAQRNNAGEHYVDTLRHRVYAALARLNEVTPVRDQLWPEFRREFDRLIERAESR